MIDTTIEQSLIGIFVYCTTQKYLSGSIIETSVRYISVESSDHIVQEILLEEFNYHFVIGE